MCRISVIKETRIVLPDGRLVEWITRIHYKWGSFRISRYIQSLFLSFLFSSFFYSGVFGLNYFTKIIS